MILFRQWRINRLKDQILYMEEKAEKLFCLRKPNGHSAGSIMLQAIELETKALVKRQQLERLEKK